MLNKEKMLINKSHHRRITLILSAIILLAASCSRDPDTTPANDGKSVYVYDLVADTSASMGDVDGKTRRQFYPLIFSMSTGQSRLIQNLADSATYLKNAYWDLAFTKEYNSLVQVNGGAYAGTPGYGGPGVGQLLVLEKAYDQVNEAPSDEVFNNRAVSGVGWDNGSGIGWYFYSMSNHIAVPIKHRTFVLKTATGKFAKLELLNIYKGNPPVVTDLFWPAPYLSFRYYVQTDGSRNLRTK